MIINLNSFDPLYLFEKKLLHIITYYNQKIMSHFDILLYHYNINHSFIIRQFACDHLTCQKFDS